MPISQTDVFSQNTSLFPTEWPHPTDRSLPYTNTGAYVRDIPASSITLAKTDTLKHHTLLI